MPHLEQCKSNRGPISQEGPRSIHILCRRVFFFCWTARDRQYNLCINHSMRGCLHHHHDQRVPHPYSNPCTTKSIPIHSTHSIEQWRWNGCHLYSLFVSFMEHALHHTHTDASASLRAGGEKKNEPEQLRARLKWFSLSLPPYLLLKCFFILFPSSKDCLTAHTNVCVANSIPHWLCTWICACGGLGSNLGRSTFSHSGRPTAKLMGNERERDLTQYVPSLAWLSLFPFPVKNKL